MLRLPARLPDPLVRFLPHRRCAFDLIDQHRPQPLGNVIALLGVQVDGVQHRAEHVVLALVVRAVADPHRPRAPVALEMVERRLLEVFLASDAIHDLQRAVLVARDFGDVLDEVVGLPVQTERVQRPQRERRVAHPAVAVVPVAFAARRLRQRGRRRGDERPGRHERQPLQHERRALQVRAPRMVWIGAFGQPATPEVPRPLDDLFGFLGGVRSAPRLRPGDRREAFLAFGHRVAPVRTVALDAHPDVAVEPEHRPTAGRVHRERVVRVRRVVRVLGVGLELDLPPLRRRGAVVEHRLADDLDLHLALDAFDHPHEQVVGIEVGRRARVALSRARCRAIRRSPARRPRGSSPVASSMSSRSCSSRGYSAGQPAHTAHTVRRATIPPRGRAARRRPMASRSTAGTSTRSTRPRRPARRCGSPTGSHSRRSAETASRRRTLAM